MLLSSTSSLSPFSSLLPLPSLTQICLSLPVVAITGHPFSSSSSSLGDGDFGDKLFASVVDSTRLPRLLFGTFSSSFFFFVCLAFSGVDVTGKFPVDVEADRLFPLSDEHLARFLRLYPRKSGCSSGRDNFVSNHCFSSSSSSSFPMGVVNLMFFLIKLTKSTALFFLPSLSNPGYTAI